MGQDSQCFFCNFVHTDLAIRSRFVFAVWLIGPVFMAVSVAFFIAFFWLFFRAAGSSGSVSIGPVCSSPICQVLRVLR